MINCFFSETSRLVKKTGTETGGIFSILQKKLNSPFKGFCIWHIPTCYTSNIPEQSQLSGQWGTLSSRRVLCLLWLTGCSWAKHSVDAVHLPEHRLCSSLQRDAVAVTVIILRSRWDVFTVNGVIVLHSFWFSKLHPNHFGWMALVPTRGTFSSDSSTFWALLKLATLVGGYLANSLAGFSNVTEPGRNF